MTQESLSLSPFPRFSNPLLSSNPTPLPPSLPRWFSPSALDQEQLGPGLVNKTISWRISVRFFGRWYVRTKEILQIPKLLAISPLFLFRFPVCYSEWRMSKIEDRRGEGGKEGKGEPGGGGLC